MEKRKVCLVCERYQLQREYLPFHEALEKQFDLNRYFADVKWPEDISEIEGYETFDALIWFVRFRELRKRPAFRWGNYNGVRIMYDQDACQDFSLIAGDRYLGAWPEVFRKNEFQVLACTGKATRDHLLEKGVNAYWIPKAYDKRKLFDKGETRKGICYFGELYTSRAAMLHYLKKRGIEVTKFRCSHFELNDYLNRYQICLICDMVAVVNRGVAKWASRLIPSYGVKLYPGPEVMLKNFEVAATGCVAFCDDVPELRDLGFEDGKTMVSYRDFDELAEKVEFYSRSPELLSEISRKAIDLCSKTHTWSHRAEEFEKLIEAYSKNQHFIYLISP